MRNSYWRPATRRQHQQLFHGRHRHGKPRTKDTEGTETAGRVKNTGHPWAGLWWVSHLLIASCLSISEVGRDGHRRKRTTIQSLNIQNCRVVAVSTSKRHKHRLGGGGKFNFTTAWKKTVPDHSRWFMNRYGSRSYYKLLICACGQRSDDDEPNRLTKRR